MRIWTTDSTDSTDPKDDDHDAAEIIAREMVNFIAGTDNISSAAGCCQNWWSHTQAQGRNVRTEISLFQQFSLAPWREERVGTARRTLGRLHEIRQLRELSG